MLTGDNEGTAKAIVEQVGVDEYRAELLPGEKVTAVDELVKEYGTVAMVSDGINDAPAMATATVGMAMGAAGTDTALDTAEIALMADDLVSSHISTSCRARPTASSARTSGPASGRRQSLQSACRSDSSRSYSQCLRVTSA